MPSQLRYFGVCFCCLKLPSSDGECGASEYVS
jgi:hypothetical protein